MTEPAFRATTRVATENASKYLQQLCKHFQHKLPASFEPTSGSITFPFGEVKLAADAEALAMSLEAPSGGDLERLEDVVARHLSRFAFREELVVAWRPDA